MKVAASIKLLYLSKWKRYGDNHPKYLLDQDPRRSKFREDHFIRILPFIQNICKIEAFAAASWNCLLIYRRYRKLPPECENLFSALFNCLPLWKHTVEKSACHNEENTQQWRQIIKAPATMMKTKGRSNPPILMNFQNNSERPLTPLPRICLPEIFTNYQNYDQISFIKIDGSDRPSQ